VSQLLVAVPYELIEEAFNNIDVAAPPLKATSGAPKVYSDAPIVDGAVRDAWAKLRALIERCLRQGKQIVQDEVAGFMEFVEMTCSELGALADEFRDRLLGKIREMIQQTFDLLLKAMRSDIVVGARAMVLKTITLEHKLVYSSSLKVSLASLCELVAGGELKVTGSYELSLGV
jgi:hypothetical protein